MAESLLVPILSQGNPQERQETACSGAKATVNLTFLNFLFCLDSIKSLIKRFLQTLSQLRPKRMVFPDNYISVNHGAKLVKFGYMSPSF